MEHIIKVLLKILESDWFGIPANNIPGKTLIKRIIAKEDDKFVIFGDFHGSFATFIRHLLRLRLLNILDKDCKLKDNYHLIFLGDIVDRGVYGYEIIMLLYLLKIKNPNNVHLNRGNHEEKKQNTHDGFKIQMETQFGEQGRWININIAMETQHSAILIKNPINNKYIYLAHGGLPVYQSSYILDRDFIDNIKNDENGNIIFNNDQIGHIIRWNDFTGESKSTVARDSFVAIGQDKLDEAFSHNIELIIRGHQDLHHNTKIFLKSEIDPKDINLLKPPKLNKNVNYKIRIDDKTGDIFIDGIENNQMLRVITLSTNTDFGRNINSDGFGILSFDGFSLPSDIKSSATVYSLKSITPISLIYDLTKKNTDIADPSFYATNIVKPNSTIYLINGANENLSSGGRGTNGAISSLFKSDKGLNVFDPKNIEIIYDPRTDSIINKNESFLELLKKKGYKNSVLIDYPAGTVIRSKYTDIINSHTIGVYHILGYDFRELFKKNNPECEIINKTLYNEYHEYFSYLAYQYYTHILKDFYSNLTNAEYINLSQVPGNIFCGTDETKLGMAQAIYDFKIRNRNPTRNITIFYDMDKSQYDDYNNLIKFIHIYKIIHWKIDPESKFFYTDPNVYKILSWNVSFGCMLSNDDGLKDKSTRELVKHCKQLNDTTHINQCLKNVATHLDLVKMDFIGLQEASNFSEIQKSMKRKYDIIHSKQFEEDMCILYDSNKYMIIFKFFGNLSETDGRPYQIVIFYNKNKKNYTLIINVHFPHGFSEDKLQVVFGNIEIKNFKSTGNWNITEVDIKNLKELLSDPSLDVIMMGDFNDLTQNFWTGISPFKKNKDMPTNIQNMILKADKRPPLTCCTGLSSLRSKTNKETRIGDYILTNSNLEYVKSNELFFDEILIDATTYPTSDHMPVCAVVRDKLIPISASTPTPKPSSKLSTKIPKINFEVSKANVQTVIEKLKEETKCKNISLYKNNILLKEDEIIKETDEIMVCVS